MKRLMLGLALILTTVLMSFQVWAASAPSATLTVKFDRIVNYDSFLDGMSIRARSQTTATMVQMTLRGALTGNKIIVSPMEDSDSYTVTLAGATDVSNAYNLGWGGTYTVYAMFADSIVDVNGTQLIPGLGPGNPLQFVVTFKMPSNPDTSTTASSDGTIDNLVIDFGQNMYTTTVENGVYITAYREDPSIVVAGYAKSVNSPSNAFTGSWDDGSFFGLVDQGNFQFVGNEPTGSGQRYYVIRETSGHTFNWNQTASVYVEAGTTGTKFFPESMGYGNTIENSGSTEMPAVGLSLVLGSGTTTLVDRNSGQPLPDLNVTGLNFFPNDGQLTLYWNSVSGASDYRVYRDGIRIAAGLTEPRYTDTGLINGQEHSYEVMAFDASGGHSANVTSITAAAEAAAPGELEYHTISGTVTDSNGTVAGAQVAAFSFDTEAGNVTTTDGNGTYQFSVPAGSGYKVYVHANGHVEAWYIGSGQTTTCIEDANGIDVFADTSGIDFNLSETANTISGTITLPMAVPADGLFILAGAQDQDGGLCVTRPLYVPSGSSTIDYDINLPTGDSYYVVAQIFPNWPMCYYAGSEDGTTDITSLDSSNATLINAHADSIDINIPGHSISGTVTLPSAVSADTVADVEAIRDPGTPEDPSDDLYFETEVTIPSGNSTFDYTIAVPPYDNYRVMILIQGYPDVFYGNTTDWKAAAIVDASAADQTGINITMVAGKTISGTVTDENGPVAGANVDAWSDILGAGGDAVTDANGTYQVSVPAGSGYKVHVHKDGYPDYFYCATDPNGTTTSWDDATELDVSSGSLSGIDLVLAAGKTISGTITLPSSAPADGLDIWVDAFSDAGTPEDWSDDLWGSTNVHIDAGQSTAAYSISVPPNNPAYGYRVHVHAEGYPDYLYCANATTCPDGITTSWDEATLVDVSASSQSGINMTLSPGNSISGTITLPSSAPTGGLDIWIDAFSDGGTPEDWSDDLWGGTNVHIYAGNKSGNYTIGLPPGSGYRIHVHVDGYPDYFYCATCSGGITTSWDEATLIDVSASSQSGIDMTLKAGNSISGIITLPNPAPAGGLDIWIDAFSDGGTPEDWSDDLWGGTNVHVDAGNDSGNYTISLAPNASGSGYRVQVHIGGYPDYFYSSTDPNGTTTSWDEASLVDVSVSSQTGINMTLSAGVTIAGRVTDATTGNGIPGIWVNAWSESTFNSGGGMTDEGGYYTINVVSAPDYRVDVWAEGYVHLFYNNTSDWDSATLVDVTGGSATGIDFSLSSGTTISGTISGVASGDTVWVNAWSESTGSGGGVEVMGTGSPVDYTITGLSQAADFKVDVWSENYAHVFYDGTSDWDHATLVSTESGDVTGIDFTLSTGYKIFGTITGLASGNRVWINAWSESTGAGNGVELYNDNGTYKLNGQPLSEWSLTGSENYVIPGLQPAADYRVDVWSEGYMHVFYKKDASNNATSDWNLATLVSTESGNATLSSISLSSGRSISGTISGVASGDSLWVNAWSESTGSWGGIEVEAAGSSVDYTITGLSQAADFKVDIWSDKYAHVFYDGTSDWDHATLVSTESGDVTGINFSLSTGYKISGTITGLATGDRVWINAWSESTGAGNGIELYNDNGNYRLNGRPLSEQLTDAQIANGTNYVIPGLQPAKDYRVDVWSEDYMHVFYKSGSAAGTSDWAQATLINVSADVSGIDITLGNGGSIAGTITGLEAGEEAWINAWNPELHSWGGTSITSSGKFTISGLAPTSSSGYIIDIWSPSHPHVFYKEGADGNVVNDSQVEWEDVTIDSEHYWEPKSGNVTRVTVAATGATTLSDINLGTLVAYSITLKIDHIGIGDRLWVGAWSSNGGNGKEVVTDNATKTVTVSGLPPADDYMVDVWSEKYMHVFYKAGVTNNSTPNIDDIVDYIDLTSGNADITANPITLSAGYSISGKVTINGNPAPGLWVSAWSEDEIMVGNGAVTDGSGNYTISGLPNISGYTVEVWTENGYAKQTDVDLSSGSQTGIDLAIGGTGVINISGTVTSSGNPVSGAIVAVFDDSGSSSGSFDADDLFVQGTSTSSDGTYSFSNLPGGTYWVRVDYEADGTYDATSGAINSDNSTVNFTQQP